MDRLVVVFSNEVTNTGVISYVSVVRPCDPSEGIWRCRYCGVCGHGHGPFSKGLDEAQVSGLGRFMWLSGLPFHFFCHGFSEAHSPGHTFHTLLLSHGLFQPF